MLPLGLDPLLSLLLPLLDRDLLILQFLVGLPEVLEVDEKQVRVNAWGLLDQADALNPVHDLIQSFFEELTLDIDDGSLECQRGRDMTRR